MTIWAMVIFIFSINGSAEVLINFPNDYTYNSQKNCEEQAAIISAKIQESNKTEIQVGWICKPIDYNRIEKALPPKI